MQPNNNDIKKRNSPRKDGKKDDKWKYFVVIGIIIFIFLLILILNIFGPDREPCCNTNEDIESLTPIPISPHTSNFTVWNTFYPEGYDDEGEMPIHPDWVLNETINATVIIFVHSGTCEPCIKQEKDIEDVLSEMESNITFIDVRTDDETKVQRMNDVFNVYYDPEHPHAIPLTVFLYLDNEDIKWYSYAGYLGKEMIIEHTK